MKLPNFLVIGAMKCGTTTLYNDLATNPEIFLPDKELNALISDQVLTVDGKDRYAQRYRKAAEFQCCGDVSTEYSKLPDIPGVASRAKQILSGSLKIVYLVREPVSRCLSHHRHMSNTSGDGRMGPDINQEIHIHPSLIAYSQYAMQLRPWVESFGLDAVRLIRFEDYIQQRRETVTSLGEFLGVCPRPELIDPDQVYNQSENRHVAAGSWHKVLASSIYRDFVRPILPTTVRERFRTALLPKAKPRPVRPTVATIELIIERVRDDAEELQKLLGCEPLWNFDDVLRQFHEKPAMVEVP
jgi:hypothetical protein